MAEGRIKGVEFIHSHGRIKPRDGCGVVAFDAGKITPNKPLRNTPICCETARNKIPHSAQFHPRGSGLSRRKQGFDSPWGRHKNCHFLIFFVPLLSPLGKSLLSRFDLPRMAASRPGFIYVSKMANLVVGLLYDASVLLSLALQYGTLATALAKSVAASKTTHLLA